MNVVKSYCIFFIYEGRWSEKVELPLSVMKTKTVAANSLESTLETMHFWFTLIQTGVLPVSQKACVDETAPFPLTQTGPASSFSETELYHIVGLFLATRWRKRDVAVDINRPGRQKTFVS